MKISSNRKLPSSCNLKADEQMCDDGPSSCSLIRQASALRLRVRRACSSKLNAPAVLLLAALFDIRLKLGSGDFPSRAIYGLLLLSVGEPRLLAPSRVTKNFRSYHFADSCNQYVSSAQELTHLCWGRKPEQS